MFEGEDWQALQTLMDNTITAEAQFTPIQAINAVPNDHKGRCSFLALKEQNFNPNHHKGRCSFLALKEQNFK